MRYTHDMHACGVHAYEMHAHEVYPYDMHAREVQRQSTRMSPST
jgi:hypothetical protein